MEITQKENILGDNCNMLLIFSYVCNELRI